MTAPQAPRRGLPVALCLLTVGLIVLLAVRHAQALGALVPLSFGVAAVDVVLFALLVALLAGAAAALDRALRHGLPRRGVQALGLGIVVLLVLLAVIGDPEDVGYESGPFSGAYSSQLFIDFSPTLPWLVAAVLVAGLGLLPVAAVSAARPGAHLALTPRRRAAVLTACALSLLLLGLHLERTVALLDLLRGRPQELGATHAITWVALLWALVGIGWSAAALLRAAASVPRLAVLVPAGVLVGAALLLLDDRGRHECCFDYVTVQLDGTNVTQDPPAEQEFVPPPLLPDLLLLGGALGVGVALPLGLQRLRVRTSASTPPG